MRTFLFRGATSLSERIEQLAHVLLWLGAGTQRHVDFDEMVRRSWANYSLDEHEIAAGWHASEREVYSKFVRPGDRVLVIGCGSGRDLLPFLGADREVVGVEPSPEPAKRLRTILERRGDRTTRVIEGAIEHVTAPGAFDAIVFSRLCYGYIRQSSRRIAVLKTLRRHLTGDGRMILTYVPAPEDRRCRAMYFARMTAWITRSDWMPEPNDVLQRESTSAGGGQLLHYEHWFSPQEIEMEAQAAGLSILAHWSPEGAPTLVVTM